MEPLWKRLLWFVSMWGGSIAALDAVAYVIRFAIHS
jgi:hypothetical protein